MDNHDKIRKCIKCGCLSNGAQYIGKGWARMLWGRDGARSQPTEKPYLSIRCDDCGYMWKEACLDG